MNPDLEHLRLLSIFHYVLAGLIGLVSLFPVFHLVLGIAMMTGALDTEGDPVAPLVGGIFAGFALLIILCGFALAAAVAMTGRALGRHESYTFCLVVAAIECMFMPLGTVLGVFTLIVLLRPSVKGLFGVAPPELPAQP
ncbi:MAG TPA: hypothetical protein VM778_08015 [Gemmatimonadota bacterium]|nr:hypothetical protein [Gemmatimonadota bacterium]